MGGPLRIILLVLFVILIIALIPAWPYSTGWGYYPCGGLGILFLIFLFIAFFSGRRPV